MHDQRLGERPTDLRGFRRRLEPSATPNNKAIQGVATGGSPSRPWLGNDVRKAVGVPIRALNDQKVFKAHLWRGTDAGNHSLACTPSAGMPDGVRQTGSKDRRLGLRGAERGDACLQMGGGARKRGCGRRSLCNDQDPASTGMLIVERDRTHRACNPFPVQTWSMCAVSMDSTGRLESFHGRGGMVGSGWGKGIVLPRSAIRS